jgi:UDP-N-acetylmuramoylalanine--D-glutamate ligase
VTLTMTPSVPAIDLVSLTLESFRDRPVAVLGLARSGVALSRFLLERGALVTVYDGRSADDLGDVADAVAELGARLRLGPEVDPAAVLRGQALICTSPSVNSRFPTTEPRLRTALGNLEAEGRTPVVSEIDLFLRLCPSATTGSMATKGKTTTSSLVAAILARGEAPVLLGGNIGTPLVERLPELTTRHRVVLELSDLQLPTLSRGTDVAVYTHVTSDHLDRHGSLEAYRAVKRRLAELVPSSGAFVRNDDDAVVRDYRPGSDAVVVPYTSAAPMPGGVGVVDGWIVADAVPHRYGGGSGGGLTDGRVLPLDAIALPGAHNISNVGAAVAVGLLHGIAVEAIREAVAAFTGVEHRLEVIDTIDGIRYVNDSQGTQPDAVIAAVRSFPKPLVLIAGGRSKGVPSDCLAAVVVERVSAAVLIGETAAELEGAFAAAGLRTIEQAGSMEDAVARATVLAAALRASDRPAADPRAADRRAGPGAAAGGVPLATVLLSPAAASFDMFRDYEARGAAFKASVRALPTHPDSAR